MSGPPVARLRFRDGVEREIEVGADESVLAAALRAGLNLVHQCEQGSCGTCIARLVEGETMAVPGRPLALLEGEIRDGHRLTCSVRIAGPCAFELDYPSALIAGGGPARYAAEVAGLDWLSRSVIRLELALGPGAGLAFRPGQYVRIRVPGTGEWRSYSMASTAKDLPRLVFLVRYLAGGAMSEWLKDGCAPGRPVEIEGPHGSFGLIDAPGPVLMVAGGTGLAPLLAMLDALRDRPGPRPQAVLCFGCNTRDDLFYDDELELRAFWMPSLELRVALMERPAGGFDGRIGDAVSLIGAEDLARPGLTAYLCGPPGMVEAARERLIAGGVPPDRVRAEQFRPTAA